MRRGKGGLALALTCGLLACQSGPGEVPLRVPRGHMQQLQLVADGRWQGFGPFVGYYFRPEDPRDLSRLRFLCFNENGFYSSDAPRNALLFEGEAILATLPPGEVSLLGAKGDRIRPAFFPVLPASWLATRPEPSDEFVHFHSCYDARGPTHTGYWLRHVVARQTFTYDMGGRVEEGSPLFHRATPGPDRGFAHSVEFDRGPGMAP